MAGLKNNSQESLMTIIGLEHLLLGFVILFRVVYDCDPEWVEIFLQRRAYRKDAEGKVSSKN